MIKKMVYFAVFILLIVVVAACDIFDFSEADISTNTSTVIFYTNTPNIETTSTAQRENTSNIPTVTTFISPSLDQTQDPTVKPTQQPTVKPTEQPTVKPSDEKILSGLKICIDPGHQIKGNYDKELCAPWSESLKSKVTSGTSGNFVGTDEYIITLQISQKIKEKLVYLGAEVLMTREIHDVDISNKERAEMSNNFGADITLRIHCNSADSSTAEGIDLFVRDVGDGTIEYKKQSDLDFNIATEMLDYICNATNAKKRYVNRSDIYTGINWCNNTCIIVECGFMSNEKEDRLLNTSEYQDKIAEGIKNYFVSTRT